MDHETSRSAVLRYLVEGELTKAVSALMKKLEESEALSPVDVVLAIIAFSAVTPPVEEPLGRCVEGIEPKGPIGLAAHGYSEIYCNNRPGRGIALLNGAIEAANVPMKLALNTGYGCVGYFLGDQNIMRASAHQGRLLARELLIDPPPVRTVLVEASLFDSPQESLQYIQHYTDALSRSDLLTMSKLRRAEGKCYLQLYGRSGCVDRALLQKSDDCFMWANELKIKTGLRPFVEPTWQADEAVHEFTKWVLRERDLSVESLIEDANDFGERQGRFGSMRPNAVINFDGVVLPILLAAAATGSTSRNQLEAFNKPLNDVIKGLAWPGDRRWKRIAQPLQSALAILNASVFEAHPQARLISYKSAYYASFDNPNVKLRSLKLLLRAVAEIPEMKDAVPGIELLIEKTRSDVKVFWPSIDHDILWPDYPQTSVTDRISHPNVITLADAVAGRMEDLVAKAERMLARRTFAAQNRQYTRTFTEMQCSHDDLHSLLETTDALPTLDGPVLWYLGKQRTRDQVREEVRAALVGIVVEWSDRAIAKFFDCPDGKLIGRIRQTLGNR